MQENDISYFVELGEHLWCLRLEKRESEERMGGARQDFQVLLRGQESQSLDLLQQVRLFFCFFSASSLLLLCFFSASSLLNIFYRLVHLFYLYTLTK